jgi:rRNA maturation endonuclease Nob1
MYMEGQRVSKSAGQRVSESASRRVSEPAEEAVEAVRTAVRGDAGRTWC